MSRGFKDEIRDCFPRTEEGNIMIPINLDFDGTVIYHGYDFEEKDFKLNGNCDKIIKRWVKKYGCKINIYTTRDKSKLEEVISFFHKYKIPFHSIGQKTDWTDSNKIYGFVIDDMSSCQIFYDKNGRPTVDWEWLVQNFEPRLKYMKSLINDIENE